MNIELVSFLDIPLEIQKQTRLWRNKENVARFFKIPYIDEETHMRWLNSLKQEHPQNMAFMIKVDNKYVGVTYFHSIDYDNRQADWGIYIYRDDLRGKGIGHCVLSYCISFAREDLHFLTLFLDVLETNERARELYIKCGFKIIDRNNSFLRYKLTLYNDSIIDTRGV